MNNIFSLNFKQVGISAFGAVLTAVVKQIYISTSGSSFNPVSYDWASLLHVAVVAFFGFLAAHFLTDQNGHPLGIGSKSS